MNRKLLAAIATMAMTAAPALASAPDAHNNGPTSARSIYCDEEMSGLEDDETSEFVRGNANLYVGESNGADAVGFSVFGNNIQTMTWNQKRTGNFDTEVFYFYTFGSLNLNLGLDSATFTVAKNGSLNWSWDKLNTGIPRNAQVRQIYVVDFPGGSFTDVSTGLKANSLTPGTLKGPVLTDCEFAR